MRLCDCQICFLPRYTLAADSAFVLLTRAEILARIRQAQERRAFFDLECFYGIVDEMS